MVAASGFGVTLSVAITPPYEIRVIKESIAGGEAFSVVVENLRR
jgi:hypothetical protein